ncbi:MAG: T9SS type A sorting domain-containing protein, partial [candidate division Zixibacteria bacterium]|nr:T9SS type A sorting domain-containing protein [candidate division Zixibacteria bacterium]
GPSSDVVNVIVSDGRITVECASAIGGILFKFDGKVTPTLPNTNMELLSNEGNVLVWSGAGHSINAGASQLLTVSGELVSVIAVDREGRDLATTITTKVAPSTFALHPAYPNPFNPNTNLSFSLPNASAYSLNIYNVAGQLVRSYEGMGNVGLNVITWDGKDNAGNAVSSGIYFYKLIAGSFTATNKMIMLK